MELLNALRRNLRIKRVRKAADKRRENIEDAIDKFDVTIDNYTLWLRVNGELVCPMSMFTSNDVVTVVEQIRKMYINRMEKCV